MPILPDAIQPLIGIGTLFLTPDIPWGSFEEIVRTNEMQEAFYCIGRLCNRRACQRSLIIRHERRGDPPSPPLWRTCHRR
jgi:hypothetical protein